MPPHPATLRDELPNPGRALVAALGLLAAGAAWPLSFGTVEGNARFGAALDLRVPLTLDDRSEALAPCVQVDVWYGRDHLDASKVRAEVQIVGKTGGSVRVRSAATVDQPVVTVALSTTCGQRTLRHVVLVAEGVPADFRAAAEPDLQPVAVAPAMAAVPVPSTPEPVGVAVPSSPAASATKTPAPVTAKRASAPAVTAAAPKPVTPMRRARSDVMPAPVAARAPAGPAAAPASEAGPRLRLSGWMASTAPATTEAERAQARAVWKILQTDAGVLAREWQQAQAAPVPAVPAAPASTAASRPAVASEPAQAPVAAPLVPSASAAASTPVDPAPLPAPAPAVVAVTVLPPPVAAAPSPEPPPVPARRSRDALWNRVAASMESVVGLLPLAMGASVVVLAGVVLAMRLQRRRRARRDEERLDTRRSDGDTAADIEGPATDPAAVPAAVKAAESQFAVALDIDLESGHGAGTAAPATR